jgi:hypothetical protein
MDEQLMLPSEEVKELHARCGMYAEAIAEMWVVMGYDRAQSLPGWVQNLASRTHAAVRDMKEVERMGGYTQP